MGDTYVIEISRPKRRKRRRKSNKAALIKAARATLAVFRESGHPAGFRDAVGDLEAALEPYSKKGQSNG
ncbi:hypothetical protein LCGC14_2503110 [marine sediment metagenome]|uniref:Uncharacterized protein n=1 Tax=marine sediment metagenome TaxID=412755 RepID=A0A0F9DUY5_9ZZZZ